MPAPIDATAGRARMRITARRHARRSAGAQIWSGPSPGGRRPSPCPGARPWAERAQSGRRVWLGYQRRALRLRRGRWEAALWPSSSQVWGRVGPALLDGPWPAEPSPAFRFRHGWAPPRSEPSQGRAGSGPASGRCWCRRLRPGRFGPRVSLPNFGAGSTASSILHQPVL